MADSNHSVDLSKPVVAVGGSPGVPGKKIGGMTKGEAVRLEQSQDRVTILQGLDGNSFKIMPLESIDSLLTISLKETAKTSIKVMDALYAAGVPFNVEYRDGDTQLDGVGMVLGRPPQSISTDPAPRVYRVGILNMVGTVGAAATTESGADLEP